MAQLRLSPIRTPLVVFLASAGALAWLTPHRPRAVIPSDNPDFVHVIGFSPDGSLLATCDDEPAQAGVNKRDLSVNLRDVSPDGSLRQLATRRGSLLPFLAWSWIDDPGRRWLFWECMRSENPDQRLHELLHGRPADASEIDPTESPQQVRISEEGRYLAVREIDGTYSIRDRETNRVLLTLPNIPDPPVFGPEPATATFFIWSDQPGERLVVSRDVLTGRELRRHQVPLDSRRTARLSCEGHWIVGEKNGGSAVFNTLDGRCAELLAPNGSSYSRARMLDRWRWIPSSPLLVHVELLWPPVGATMRTYEAATGQTVAAFTPRTERLTDLQIAAVSFDGKQVLLRETLSSMDRSTWLPTFLVHAYMWLTWQTGGPTTTGSLWVVDTASGMPLARLPVGEECLGNGATNEGVAAFSFDGRQLAVAGVHGEVMIWDLPFRRPWLWIAGWALVPAMMVIGLGMIRRNRKSRR